MTEIINSLRTRLRTAPNCSPIARHVRAALLGCVLLLWTLVGLIAVLLPGDARAFTIDADEMKATFDISPAVLLLSAIVCIVSSATSTLIRIDREFSAATKRPLPSRLLTVASHLAGCLLGGGMGFLMAQAGTWDVWAGLLVVATGGFFGTKFIEATSGRKSGGGTPPGTSD